MNEYGPLIAAILSGLGLPTIYWIFGRLKKAIRDSVKEIKVAATEESTLAEARMTKIMEKNNADVLTVITRVEAINGKVADVTKKQAKDHDKIVWLLGKAGAALIDEEEPS